MFGKNIDTPEENNTEVKTEVVNYVLTPSGGEAVSGKLVYSNKEEEKKDPITKITDIILLPFKVIGNLFSRGKGFFSTFQTSCLSLLLIILFLLTFIVLIVLYKPAFIWNPLKTFLNNNISANEMDNINIIKIYEKINYESENYKEVSLDNRELTMLLRDYTLLDNSLNVYINDNELKFLINVDTKERPLWFIIETEKNGNKMYVSNVGFGKFNTPSFLGSLLNDTVGTIFTIIEKQVTSENYVYFFKEIINESKLKLDIKDVEMLNDKLIVKFND